jgi:hypothetical protein
LPPSPIFVGSRCSQALVELLLEDSSGATKLGWPGQSQVAGVDLGGGAPYLHIADQLGRQGSRRLARPLLTSGAEADLVCELSNYV